MTKAYTIILGIFIILNVHGQPNIEWQNSLGGSDWDGGSSILQTSDGGFIVAGSTDSNNGDVSGNNGDRDIWIVKLDINGSLQWQNALGGSGFDFTRSIQQTADGGYVLIGSTESNDGDVSNNHGASDYWVVKLDIGGNIQWEKSFGGSDHDIGYSIKQTTDGGYIVAGETRSNDGNVTGNHGLSDYWVVRLSSTGLLLWQVSLGGSNDDVAFDVIQTNDGGFVVSGQSESNDGDVTSNQGGDDYWVVKLDDSGVLQWQSSYGGSLTDRALHVQQTSDGGYIVSGESASNDGDVSGNNGSVDYWVVKLNAGGMLQWQNTYGGSDADFGRAVLQTNDNGYVLTGTSRSDDGDVSFNNGGFLGDFWTIRIDSIGNLIWEKAIGGSDNDGSSSIQQTNDGGYIIAGGSDSNDGDVSGNHGDFDMWVVKLSPDPTSVYEYVDNSGFGLYPNPAKNELYIEFHKAYNAAIQIELYNITGTLIRSINTKLNTGDRTLQITTNDLPAGIYQVRSTIDQTVLTQKFIKL